MAQEKQNGRPDDRSPLRANRDAETRRPYDESILNRDKQREKQEEKH
jgi:hypothetical protein